MRLVIACTACHRTRAGKSGWTGRRRPAPRGRRLTRRTGPGGRRAGRPGGGSTIGGRPLGGSAGGGPYVTALADVTINRSGESAVITYRDPRGSPGGVCHRSGY